MIRPVQGLSLRVRISRFALQEIRSVNLAEVGAQFRRIKDFPRPKNDPWPPSSLSRLLWIDTSNDLQWLHKSM